MATGQLHIDLHAICANWRALAERSRVATGACVKADGYGLGAGPVSKALYSAGCRRFYVAVASEAKPVRAAVGPEAEIAVFSGHMEGDASDLAEADAIPMLNSARQVERHRGALPGHAFGVQLDSGMNRLGMEPNEWAQLRESLLADDPILIMSHLACADEPDHPMNRRQLDAFRAMTDGTKSPRSLAATGGILLGPEYHFDATRPGIGLYGGAPYVEGSPVVRLSAPIIQIRKLEPGETVGYGNTWTAPTTTRIATVPVGYADGFIRAASNRGHVYVNGQACAIRGRVSMDLLTVDVSACEPLPDRVDLLGPEQGIEDLAIDMGTIGYEVLTSLGARYRRSYAGSP